MNDSMVEKEILSMAVEDYYGLWEVVWRLNTLFPDRATSDLIEIAHSKVKKLLKEGKISIFQRSKLGEQEIPVLDSDSDRGGILSDEANWSEPEPDVDSMQYLIAATTRGENTYFSGE